MFCLVADVEIRRETGNHRGLQDALRAIVNSGGTIDKDWPVSRIFRIGDEATGTSVLKDLYARWSESAVMVDLADLWKQLGIKLKDGDVVFDESAPLADLRFGITVVPRR